MKVPILLVDQCMENILRDFPKVTRVSRAATASYSHSMVWSILSRIEMRTANHRGKKCA